MERRGHRGTGWTEDAIDCGPAVTAPYVDGVAALLEGLSAVR